MSHSYPSMHAWSAQPLWLPPQPQPPTQQVIFPPPPPQSFFSHAPFHSSMQPPQHVMLQYPSMLSTPAPLPLSLLRPFHAAGVGGDEPMTNGALNRIPHAMPQNAMQHMEEGLRQQEHTGSVGVQFAAAPQYFTSGVGVAPQPHVTHLSQQYHDLHMQQMYAQQQQQQIQFQHQQLESLKLQQEQSQMQLQRQILQIQSMASSTTAGSRSPTGTNPLPTPLATSPNAARKRRRSQEKIKSEGAATVGLADSLQSLLDASVNAPPVGVAVAAARIPAATAAPVSSAKRVRRARVVYSETEDDEEDDVEDEDDEDELSVAKKPTRRIGRPRDRAYDDDALARLDNVSPESFVPNPSIARLMEESLLPDIDTANGITYSCRFPHCGDSFKTRFSLKRHLKKHSGEKPFVCNFQSCNKRFAEKSTLKRHVRIHTGEKPYRCSVPGCGKFFADRTNVKRHEMIHSGRRPYWCPHESCSRGYFWRKHLKKHMMAAHKREYVLSLSDEEAEIDAASDEEGGIERNDDHAVEARSAADTDEDDYQDDAEDKAKSRRKSAPPARRSAPVARVAPSVRVSAAASTTASSSSASSPRLVGVMATVIAKPAGATASR